MGLILIIHLSVFNINMEPTQRERERERENKKRIKNTMTKEVRSPEDHCLVAWANLTTVGVMPAAKYDWFLTSMTNLIASHKRNAVGIIIHCNRASDGGRTFVVYIQHFPCEILKTTYGS